MRYRIDAGWKVKPVSMISDTSKGPSLKSIRRQLEHQGAQANQTKKFDDCSRASRKRECECSWGRKSNEEGSDNKLGGGLELDRQSKLVRDGVAFGAGLSFSTRDGDANENCGGIGHLYNSKLPTGLSRFLSTNPKGSRSSRTRGRLTDTGTKAGGHEASKARYTA